MLKPAVQNDSKISLPCPFESIIGQSPEIREVFRMAQRVVHNETTIMITGESGTGKGLIAKAIHQSSNRRNHRFVSINCGAVPENLIESELFGYVRGAFTGRPAGKSENSNRRTGALFFWMKSGT